MFKIMVLEKIGAVYIVLYKTTVKIFNDLDDNFDLTIHCKSKDDDLGIHVIPPWDVFSWKFRVNFSGTTLYFFRFSKTMLYKMLLESWKRWDSWSEDTKMSTQILGEVSLEKTTVEIYNKLDNGTLLTVHCKSKDDDLGSHDLSENQSFRWKFRINIYGTTLFYCRFTWKGGSKTFNIFDAKRDENRCPPTCIWRVRNDGVHAYHDD
ncbi:hypothetical protein G4B88_026768 [Cannabis sativa]|uniref:S-protein homolog n=1 Tax=Cannabis sativa TaxID=3483 RepID=A0A7J6F973_CANSA|nr:hypothetical protein G4B88_026768 [Cannabis sativa]